MSGRPGRSGGQNKLSVEEHLLRGTFNPTRHAAQLEALRTGGAVWTPTRPQLMALGPAGRALVGRLRQHYDFSPVEGELLLEAGVTVDRLADLRRRRVEADVKTQRVLDRTEPVYVKQLAALLGVLRVPR
jgi:hypothetical protein